VRGKGGSERVFPEMNEILGDFLAESTEMLESLDQKFVDLESDPNNADLLNDIFRCMHSMKVSADLPPSSTCP